MMKLCERDEEDVAPVARPRRGQVPCVKFQGSRVIQTNDKKPNLKTHKDKEHTDDDSE